MYDLKHLPKERLEKYEQIWANAHKIVFHPVSLKVLLYLEP